MPSLNWITASLGVSVGLTLFHRMPFADHDGVLQLILLQRPYIFYPIKYTYLTMLFSTPYIALSVLGSLVYIFLVRQEETIGLVKLPPYPDPSERDKLYLVIGEVHQPKKPEPAENPRWLVIPDRGLYTGIAIFGAIGSGKTSG
jgi:hypothetical protein